MKNTKNTITLRFNRPTSSPLKRKAKPTDRLKFYEVMGKHGRHEKIDSMEWLDIYFGNVRVQRVKCETCGWEYHR